jgi:hypothetical protein
MVVELTVVNVRRYGADGTRIRSSNSLIIPHWDLRFKPLFMNGCVFAIYCSSDVEETWL